MVVEDAWLLAGRELVLRPDNRGGLAQLIP